jgi:ACS family hexuronate transporter-like MFS transporter
MQQQASAPFSAPEGRLVPARAAGAIGHYRWIICALLLFGVTKNYMDRQVLGVLADTLQRDLHWNQLQYGHVVFAFQLAYMAGMLAMGPLIDRLGTRVGYALAMVFWSVASMAHALASGLTGFIAARGALGFFEAGVFPASIKSVAEWFPKKERALATGIFNAGTNTGAIVTPLVVPWIALHLGWQWAFIITGALGFLWVAVWLLMYRTPEEHPHVGVAEIAYIRSDPPEPQRKIAWRNLLTYRQTWAFMSGRFLIDPVWWFYLFWVPLFLQRQHHLTLSQIAKPIIVIYVISDVGSVAGGWLSSTLIKRGVSVNAGRKIAMLVCAVIVTPVVFASMVHSMWGAVLLIGLAAAAHQGFSCNLFTLASDMFPSPAVASVTGMGGAAGAAGGMLIAETVGHVLQRTESFLVPFLIAGSAYLIAVGVIHLLAPRLQPAEIE